VTAAPITIEGELRRWKQRQQEQHTVVWNGVMDRQGSAPSLVSDALIRRTDQIGEVGQ
jgi:hypothetical protein